MTSDYLERLLAVSSGMAAVVQPRQMQRFESVAAFDDPFDRTAETREFVPQAQRAPEPLVGAPISAPPSTPRDTPHDSHAGASPPTHQPQTPSPPIAAKLLSSLQEPAAPPVDSTTVTPNPATTLPPARHPSVAAAEQPRQATPVRPQAQPEHVRIPAPPAATEGAAQPRRAAPLLPVVLPTTPRLPQPERVNSRDETTVAAPDVAIRIDRIEIHAPTPAAPASRQAPATQQPGALADYLARRRQGGW